MRKVSDAALTGAAPQSDAASEVALGLSPVELRFNLLASAFFFLFFYLVYGVADYVSGFHKIHYALLFEFERRTPFVPAVAPVYLSITALMMFAPLRLHTLRGFIPFLLSCVTMTCIAAGIFVVLPLRLDYAPVPEVPGWPVRFARFLSMKENLFPSLHAAFALLTALALTRELKSRMGRCLLWIFASAIVSSTILLHLHHLPDALGGLALAVATYGAIFRPLARADMENIIAVECACLRECFFFSLRHRRYFCTSLALYLHCLFAWNSRRILRVAFCLAQHLDDVLDGDRSIPGSPVDYVDKLMMRLERKTAPAANLMERLIDYFRGAAVDFRSQDEEPGREFRHLVELLKRDHQRMTHKLTMTAEELNRHHFATFYLSLNLALIFSRSELRARDAEDLVRAFCWCSPMRDLEDDLRKGLFNIPGEVLALTNSTGCPTETEYIQRILSSDEVGAWTVRQYETGRQALDAFAAQLPVLRSRGGYRILHLFHRALDRYARHYARAHLRAFNPAPTGKTPRVC